MVTVMATLVALATWMSTMEVQLLMIKTTLPVLQEGRLLQLPRGLRRVGCSPHVWHLEEGETTLAFCSLQ